MTSSTNGQRLEWLLHKPFIASAIIFSSFFSLVSVAVANTAAGQSISNTAVATYNDPNDPNSSLTTTSNTVVVEVAEIAGITVAASGVEDVNGEQIQPGDLIYYSFTVTNVGNDTTGFRLPNTADITGPALVSGSVEYKDPATGIWTIINDAIAPITGLEFAPGESIEVRVPITIDANAQTDDIVSVQLGNTPGDGQNQPFNPDGGDVYTVDLPASTANPLEANTTSPANGEREASATQQIVIGATSRIVPLVHLEKILSNRQAGDIADLTDDILEYTLRVEVQDTAPIGTDWSAGVLYPIALPNLTGAAGAQVLISDVLPAGTKLTGPITGPTGWTPVYAQEVPGNEAPAIEVAWTTDYNTYGINATRVGFIKSGTLAPGALIEPFRITVDTSGVDPNATAIDLANMAQIFGSSDPDNPVIIVDESGDQVPSNLDADDTDTINPIVIPDLDGNPVFEAPDDNGVTTAIDNGEDIDKNNTGVGDGGEPLIIRLAEPGNIDILNGPDNAADAIGPDGTTNTDFTNKSAFIPADTSLPGSLYDPSPVNFTNTLENSGLDPVDITLTPSAALLEDPSDLPDETVITLVAPNGATKSYTYTANSGFSPDGAPDIIIAGLASGTSIDYGVEINLPENTALSTDADIASGEEPGFPIPIVASAENNNGDTATNATINRVYTGFIKLLKESRIIQGDGPEVPAGQETFSTTEKTPQTGNIIEYRITYQNISEPSAGSGNVVLEADNLTIVDDGTGTDSGNGITSNNWAIDNDSNGVIDTSNIINSADDTLGGGISFFSGSSGNDVATDQSGSTQNSDVTKYIDTVPGAVAPQETGEFTFQRRVN